jgi:hypothetical protein
MELLVGLTVAGVALAGGYAAFASIVDHRERTTEQSEALTRDSEKRAALEDWLSGARVGVEPGGPPFSGFDGTYEGGADDELRFLTTARTPLDTRETLISFFVDRDDETEERGLVAVFTELRGTQREVWVIDPRVTEFDVAYLSGSLAGPLWMQSWISTTVLPQGIRISLQGEREDPLPPLLQRPILVPLGNTR